MKFETKLKKILEMQDSQLKASKLTNFAFQRVPRSPQQMRIRAEIDKLIKKGYSY